MTKKTFPSGDRASVGPLQLGSRFLGLEMLQNQYIDTRHGEEKEKRALEGLRGRRGWACIGLS